MRLFFLILYSIAYLTRSLGNPSNPSFIEIYHPLLPTRSWSSLFFDTGFFGERYEGKGGFSFLSLTSGQFDTPLSTHAKGLYFG